MDLTIIHKPYVSFTFSKPTSLIVTLEKWNDIVDFNQQFLSQFIFRGQSDESWPLRTSLERLVTEYHYDEPLSQKPLIYESEMLNDFRRKYPLYANTPKIDLNNIIECLSQMQHYGCPTRLLDFSYSIFVALFMALNGNFKSNSAIWAIRKFDLKLPHTDRYLDSRNIFSAPNSHIIKEINNRASKFIGVEQDGSSRSEIFPIFNTSLNERSSIQQGCFLMPSTIQKPFENVLYEYFNIEDKDRIVSVENLKERCENPVFKQDARNLILIKFIIPATLKWELSQLLRQMNITAETLFPGYDGMVKSLAYLRLREPNFYSE